ncbi:MAG: class I SAM-dependent methyltransferase, partial [Kiloniellales bacterium]
EAFLAAARQTVPDSRVSFRQGDGSKIPVKDATADSALSGLVLNFIPDPAATLRELKRCVKPGGWIAAYVWDYAGHVQFMRHFWDAAVAQKPAAAERDEGRRFPICRPQPLRKLFEDAGLQSVEVVPIDIPTPYESFDDYWTPFLSGVGPAPGYCVALDEGARNDLRERLRAALPTDPDGMILLAARAWAVRGRVGT